MMVVMAILLWNGGIGTYVKASNETHAEVGDRSNDAVRIDATRLRARVIGEGGNLGLTQAARIEYSLGGGLVNTDFIDNSAGVDTSDHEVNIKILLADGIRAGVLAAAGRHTLRVHRWMVSGVVEAPNGAHFTSCAPDYGRDEEFQRSYVAAAKDPAEWVRFVATYLSGDEAAYQAAVAHCRAAARPTPSSPCSSPTPRSRRARRCSPPTFRTTRTCAGC